MILVIGGAFQGKYDFVKNTLGISEDKIFNCFHTEMKKWIANGKEPDGLVDEIFNMAYEVIISDEVGCGIVPIEISDRQWREAVGRALCYAARKSSQVWRVHCGIGVKIKD